MPDPPVHIVQSRSGPAAEGANARAARQKALDFGNETEYVFPSLDLLAAPDRTDRPALDEEALAQNARMLETVLEDFGVKGRIVKVRPGPVVALYELEPAAGVKSSRVIGLADDIARSMSALSVRVAVVPGRNVIGIELPNTRRETVFLRELLGFGTLFGTFGNADAMYAPVASRFATYAVELDPVSAAYRDAVLNWPAMVAWLEAARSEDDVLDGEERR